MVKKKGAGLWDIIKNPIQSIKHVLNYASKYNNISTKTLQNYGKIQLSGLKIARTPLNSALTGVLNVASFGALNKMTEKAGFKDLFHLAIIATLDNGVQVQVEKNEVINIDTNIQGITQQTEYFDVNITGKYLYLTEMLNNTKKQMGDEAFFRYSALNSNNCADFIYNILTSNNIYTKQAGDFLMQDLKPVTAGLPSYIPAVLDKVTDLGGIISRLVGKGNKLKALKAFDKHLIKSKLEDLDNVDDEFVKFINTKGLRFL